MVANYVGPLHEATRAALEFVAANAAAVASVQKLTEACQELRRVQAGTIEAMKRRGGQKPPAGPAAAKGRVIVR